jgi:N utilization substance protein B
MGSRRRAREHVLQALYTADMGEQDLNGALNALWDSLMDDTDGAFGSRSADADEIDFAREMAEGVEKLRGEIDALIEASSTNWRVERMSLVDRNILRMGVYELLHIEDIPPNVTLNEAVELAKRFGTSDSKAFVNGILDRVARNHGRV